MKIIIIVALAAVLIALATAVYFMLSRPPQTHVSEEEASLQRSRQMATALKWRVIISISIFLSILLAYLLGWIQPGSAPLGR